MFLLARFNSIEKYIIIGMMNAVLQWKSNGVFCLFRKLQSYSHHYFKIFLQKRLLLFTFRISSR
eukprot:UN25126